MRHLLARIAMNIPVSTGDEGIDSFDLHERLSMGRVASLLDRRTDIASDVTISCSFGEPVYPWSSVSSPNKRGVYESRESGFRYPAKYG